MTHRAHTHQRQSGFTIIELLVVIVVIAILATLVIVSYNGVQRSALESTLKQDAQTASTIIANDSTLTGNYPNSSTSANSGKGLPASGNNKIYYLYIEPVQDLDTGEYSKPSYLYYVCNDTVTNSYRLTKEQPSPVAVPATMRPLLTTPYYGPTGFTPGPYMGPASTRSFTQYVSSGTKATMGVSYYSCSKNTTVQWQIKKPGTSTFTTIAGATTPTYTTPTIAPSDDGSQYKAVVTNPYGSEATLPGTLIVDYEP